MGREIAFICTNPEHRPRGEGHLTVHDRRWAFCPSGPETREGERFEDGHDWSPVDGIQIDELRAVQRKSVVTTTP